MKSAKEKIELYGLKYSLVTVSEDGKAIFESDDFGSKFANDNPDILRYLSAQLEQLYSILVFEEAPFSSYLRNENIIIQSIGNAS